MLGTLLVILIFGLVCWSRQSASTTARPPSPPPTPPTSSSGTTSGGQRTPPSPSNPQAFRPAPPSRHHKINFGQISKPSSTDAVGGDWAKMIEGLHDAYTGAPLNQSLGLFQCSRCTVFYHRESYALLKEINNSLCISCHSPEIHEFDRSQSRQSGADHNPSVVTLSNYQHHVGSVVTFAGKVHLLKESRRGRDFALMFENKSWSKSFKLVFFRDSVQKVGGKRYLESLVGKSVHVRGLIIHHPIYGYEIVVSEKRMILDAQ